MLNKATNKLWCIGSMMELGPSLYMMLKQYHAVIPHQHVAPLSSPTQPQPAAIVALWLPGCAAIMIYYPLVRVCTQVYGASLIMNYGGAYLPRHRSASSNLNGTCL